MTPNRTTQALDDLIAAMNYAGWPDITIGNKLRLHAIAERFQTMEKALREIEDYAADSDTALARYLQGIAEKALSFDPLS